MDEQTFTLDVRIQRIPTQADAEQLFEQIMASAAEIGARALGGFYESPEEDEAEERPTDENRQRRSRN